MNYVIVSNETNPYHNLGLEDYLFENCPKDGVVFYLWQNAHTIVIGASQNAYQECNVSLLEKEGVTLARRKTGGGAVYHHMGNLNFSFIAGDKLYDIKRQLKVILEGVKSLGVVAEFSGRNDILYKGKKFSGNAFRNVRGKNLHHGTLLVDENKELMSRYLTVSSKKIASKGVKSVGARVVNLKEVNPSISIQSLSKSLILAFEKEYGEYTLVFPKDLDFEKEKEHFRNTHWILGKNPKFTLSVSDRLSVGEVSIHINIKNNKIEDVKVFSDTLDTTLAGLIETALKGQPYQKEVIEHALKENKIKEYPEITDLLFSI